MTTQLPPTAQTKTKRDGGAQPKHHIAKSAFAVKARRAKIIKAILEGQTQEQAGIAAGYKPESAREQVAQILTHPAVRAIFAEKLEKAGLGDDFQIELYRKLATAKRYLPVRGEDEGSGAIRGFYEVDDTMAIGKAIDVAHKLAGRYIEKSEIDLKQPLTINIKKFCPRTTQPKEGA